MDIDTLRIFVETARRGSFSAVARSRRVEPSSVSRAVRVLEAQLGERLFQRTTRKLALTEAGALYLSRIEPLVDQFDEAAAEVRAVGRGPSGTLRLSTSIAHGIACILPLIETFRQRHERLTIELLMDDSPADLIRDGIDLAIRLAPSLDSTLVATKLASTHYRVVAAPRWLARHDLRHPQDLASLDVLRLTLPGFRDRWLFRDSAGSQSRVRVNGRLLISNAMALREAAVAGMGPALLADWLVAGDLDAGRLVDCFPAHAVTATDFETGIWGIYPSRQFLPGKVRVMLDFLRRELPRPPALKAG